MQPVTKLRAAACHPHIVYAIRSESASAAHVPHVPRPPPMNAPPQPPPPPRPPRSSHFGKIIFGLGAAGAGYYGYQNYDQIKETMQETLPAPVLETLGMAQKQQHIAPVLSAPKPILSPVGIREGNGDSCFEKYSTVF